MSEINSALVEGKTWLEVFQEYQPNITEDEADYLLWNETCYPFDNKTALEQIKQYYLNEAK